MNFNTPTVSGGPGNGADEKKVSYLEHEMEVLNTAYVKERSKGREARFEKMLEIAFAVVMLVMHIDAREKTNIMRILDKDLQKCVKLIQGTQVNWKGITLTVLSSFISFGGACASARFMPELLIAPRTFYTFLGYKILPTLDQWKDAGQAISTLGSGVGQMAQIPQSFEQRAQTGYQYTQGKLQRQQQEIGEAKSQKQGAVQQAHEGINKVHDAVSRAFAAAAA